MRVPTAGFDELNLKCSSKLKTVLHLICGWLRDLVPCAQFKKREKHTLRNVTFSKVAGVFHVF